MNKSRRGWTLIEMAVCLTIGALVFASAVELLGFAMHADVCGGRAAESLQSLDRLAERFASDVRSAIDVRTTAPKDAATRWTIELPDGRRIEYAFDDHSLLRTTFRADKIADRDAFALGDELKPRLELQPAGKPGEKPGVKPTEATLILDRIVEDTPPSVESIRVAVPIGWDRRFGATAKSQKSK
jgi:prepilin-type N-terminal cleavage/methylation domain-containing protein